MRQLVFVFLFLLAACDGSPTLPDGSVPDASRRPDAERPDAADSMDAGVPVDAHVPLEPCDAPGALEEQSCGRCGTRRRFCTNERTWELGPCTDERGVCTPGESRQGVCGNCGSQAEVCSVSCEWEPLGTCDNAGECAPGAVGRTRDGCAQGQRETRCTDACTFEPIGECRVEGCSTPGAFETVACGNCGTTRRFCAATGEWEYGPCESQGVCAPGSRRSEACGRCGTREVFCTTSCGWEAAACAGEGICEPGAPGRTTDGCEGGATRPTTCSAACTPAPSGACEARPPGTRGARCDGGACMDGLECSSATGVPICRESCSALFDPCSSGSCVDYSYCSDGCDLWTDAGCPSDSTCSVRFSSGEPIGVCGSIGSGTAGASCSTARDCGRQLACRRPGNGTGSCQPICDAVHPCPGGTVCRAWDAESSFGTCVRPNPAARGLVINEVDYDQLGDDATEFVELYNGGSTAVNLTGLELVLVNGAVAPATEYGAVALSGVVPPGGYAIVAVSSVPLPSGVVRIPFATETNALQNGSNDAIALIETSTGTLIDAVAYEITVADASTSPLQNVWLRGAAHDLIEGTELRIADEITGSIARSPNGADGNDAATDWAPAATASPGRAN